MSQSAIGEQSFRAEDAGPALVRIGRGSCQSWASGLVAELPVGVELHVVLG